MRSHTVGKKRGRDRREALSLSQRSSCFHALRQLDSKSEKTPRPTEDLREAA